MRESIDEMGANIHGIRSKAIVSGDIDGNRILVMKHIGTCAVWIEHLVTNVPPLNAP